jgi:RNA polymerase sigma-70 factor (ECF subfamily)
VTQPHNGVRSPEDWDQCLQQARNGSRAALGELLESYRNYLLLIANEELSQEHRTSVDPSDVVQNTVVKALAHFNDFKGKTAAEWRGWLRTILLREIFDKIGDPRPPLIRTGASDPNVSTTVREDRDPGPSPPAAVVRREEHEQLQRALPELPTEYQQVIQWHNFERRSWEEIGQLTGRSAEAARKLWSRAIERLGQRMRPRDDA